MKTRARPGVFSGTSPRLTEARARKQTSKQAQAGMTGLAREGAGLLLREMSGGRKGRLSASAQGSVHTGEILK